MLGLRKDVDLDLDIKKPLFSKHESNKKVGVINKNIFKLSKKAKICLHLYLYIINYFFDSIRFPMLINVLKKVFLYSLKKKKRTNFLKIMLGKLGKIYLTKLKINSLHSLIKLISLSLILKKVLKSIYIMK